MIYQGDKKTANACTACYKHVLLDATVTLSAIKHWRREK